MRKYQSLTFGILSCLVVLFSIACMVFGQEIAPKPLSAGPTTSIPTTESLVTLTPIPIFTVTPAITPSLLPSLTPTTTPVRFAVIGDYGEGNQGESDVSQLVKGWNPDFIITTGDNNYPNGSPLTIDDHIGQYYQDYIYPYVGKYGKGADHNRFFPTLGNHDWYTGNAQPYLDYFVLPGNERYYDFVWGPIHFFALDSDSREPNGVSRSSIQATWLEEKLAASTSSWNVVYMHHPAYSSGRHGSVDWMQWPFTEWGASAVLAGHDHLYERLLISGIPYFTNGLGGGPIYDFWGLLEGSQVRFNQDYGAMLVVADTASISFQFITRQGETIDTYQLQH